MGTKVPLSGTFEAAGYEQLGYEQLGYEQADYAIKR